MEALRSRRDRNMDAKRARIFAAAHDLLQTHGYAGMTTQQVSDRADVAAGTLFRYAATKADLLLMVYNERFREAITEGRRAAAGLSDPIEAVFALVMPVLKGSAEQLDTAILYQRELLFGHEKMLHRQTGLLLVADLEDGVASALLAASQADGPQARLLAERAARLIFACLHLALAQPSTGAHPDRAAATELHAQVAIMVDGFLVGLNKASSGESTLSATSHL